MRRVRPRPPGSFSPVRSRCCIARDRRPGQHCGRRGPADRKAHQSRAGTTFSATRTTCRRSSTGYSREIEISEIVTNGVANPNLRRLRVRIRYGRMIGQGGAERPGAGVRADDVHLGDFLRTAMLQSRPSKSFTRRARVIDEPERGFTLVELLVAMAITTVILGATMARDERCDQGDRLGKQVTELNNGLRTAMDMMDRDMMQVGQGLPAGRVDRARRAARARRRCSCPVRSDSNYQLDGPSFCPPDPNDATPDTVCEQISAVVPGPGRGPQLDRRRPADRHDHDDPGRQRFRPGAADGASRPTAPTSRVDPAPSTSPTAAPTTSTRRPHHADQGQQQPSPAGHERRRPADLLRRRAIRWD